METLRNTMNCNGIAWHGTATAGRGVDERSKGGAQQGTWTLRAATAQQRMQCKGKVKHSTA